MEKWIEVYGEVVKRIQNPKGQTKNGKEVTTNFIVVKWTTNYQGEDYTDYIPFEVQKWEHGSDKTLDIREGYMVKVGAVYKCYNKDDEIQINNFKLNGVSCRAPKLFPKFELKTIEVVDSSNDKESYRDKNEGFKKDVVDEGDGDLPF